MRDDVEIDEVAALAPLRDTAPAGGPPDGGPPDPRTRYLRPDPAGTPLHLETLVDDVVGR